MVKPQYVDQIPRAVKGPVKNVGDLVKARAQMDNMERIMDVLGMAFRCTQPFKSTKLTLFVELRQVQDRDIDHLSGGELQRFAIGLVCVQKADV